MRPSDLIRKFTTIIVSSLLFSGLLNGQRYTFRNYGYESGLPNDFVYTINQTDNGFLWLGTGNGIVRFDGYDFYKVNYPDSLSNRNPNTSIKDRNGAIWFGCSDGSVFYLTGNELMQLAINNTRSISQLLQGPDGMIYIIPQGRAVWRVNPDNPAQVDELLIPDDLVLFSASFSGNGKLVMGSQGSVVICELQQDTIIVENKLEGFDYSTVSAVCQLKAGSAMIAGTEDNGLYILKGKDGIYESTRLTYNDDWNYLSVKSIMSDNEGRIWVSTFGSGVVQFSLTDDYKIDKVNFYNSENGLASDDSRVVFRDLEGNYWIGLFGKGISMLASYAFEFHAPGQNTAQNDIIFIDEYKGNFILGTPDGFHLFDVKTAKSVSYKNLTSHLGGALILSYFLDDQGKLWIGSDGKGLYVMNTDGTVRMFHRSGDTGFDRINNINIDDSNIWCATTNGVLVLDRQSGRITGTFNSNNGLPGKSINVILCDKSNAYVGTESDRLYIISNLEVNSAGCLMTGNTLNRIYDLTIQKGSGKIWAATYGNGIFACDGDSVISMNTSNGLFSNYCNSILSDSRDNLWIGHANGISRYNSAKQHIITYGASYTQGGTCNPGAIYESDDQRILIGTTKGIVIYDARNDIADKVPPFNNITSVIINDVDYGSRPLISLKYGKYRIRIKYSGVNFSDPEKVYYQTFLENYEPGPAAMTSSREVSYMLSDGRYEFSLVSVGEDGTSSEYSASLTIVIAKPLYKKWWFILLVIAAIASIVVMIIRQREKAQKKIREYLENELHKRTELIVRQKNEIEIQNLEITDSINYAKRIQSSILPEVNKLKENFREAFVIFHPRDIVSGDFYWFDKLDEDRFIIVCADSTGHGVPGAFMSMIGSTLLQDIVTRKKISKPSQILTMLDKQIFSTLNQNVDLGVSNDGMDMVVCEFNLKTHHVRFASAMRPIIIVVSGESFYIKGNRSSVGGESVIDKYFDDQEYYLNEGDSIYLFSDGFPDQFGGTDGKKMKIARLKKVIEQNSKLPMWEQEKMILKFFDEWRGSYDQVDDVLMMGIRV
ncbi:MAG TPA: SpoIIE family protein phosphatase [Bacteroidales bacterium]|nr:SpoIIE family protein phosphatase [Bacteroidales bacterium]